MIDSLANVSPDVFQERFGRPPHLAARAPGRVNLLGAHVDYQGGWVLPAAIDRGIDFLASERDDRRWRLMAANLNETIELDLDALPPPVPERRDAVAGWQDVPTAVAWACQRRGLELRGLDLLFGGNLPIGAGISSSAAVESGLLLLWERLGDWQLPRRELALIGQEAEVDYLGVGSGVMDQYTSLHGRAGHALLLDCRSLDCQALPVPSEWTILVFDSGVRRQLSASGYNDRRRECEHAVDRLNAAGLEIQTLRDLPTAELERAVALLDPTAGRRVRHVVEECARVLAAADSLTAGDPAALGRAMSASHAGSRDLYEVSLPELDVLAGAATDAPGCYGARLTGAGFGGCVTALVAAGQRTQVEAAVVGAFEREFGRRPPAFECSIGEGATVEACR